VEELTRSVEKGGGVLKLEGEQVRCWLPADITHLAPELKECKPELIVLLRREGGRIATFPHCPKCGAYCLYKEWHVVRYECLCCGLKDIEEDVARRVM
jgi:hypothetical protein